MPKDSQIFLDTFHAFLNLYKYCKHEARKRQGQDLNGRQIALLRYLLEKGVSTPGELARYLLVNKSSTSEILQVMEQKGLISRLRSSDDNRQVHISLTDKGQSLARNVEVAGVPLLREKLAVMEPQEIMQLGVLLVKINTALGIDDE